MSDKGKETGSEQSAAATPNEPRENAHPSSSVSGGSAAAAQSGQSSKEKDGNGLLLVIALVIAGIAIYVTYNEYQKRKRGLPDERPATTTE